MQGDIRRWMVELRLGEGLYTKAILFYPYMTDLLPAMFLAWLEGASEEERNRLFQMLSESKKSVRRQKALEFFREYFKQRPVEVHSKDSQSKFMDKYGNILSL